jgi:hypothetical protein
VKLGLLLDDIPPGGPWESPGATLGLMRSRQTGPYAVLTHFAMKLFLAAP